jgi:hypothetical protein
VTPLRWYALDALPGPADGAGAPAATSAAAGTLDVWRRYSATISEGFCPRCRVRLHADADSGWCPKCDWYWQQRPLTDGERASGCGGAGDMVIEAEVGYARRGEPWPYPDGGNW